MGGFNSTSNMQAGSLYSIPVSSSMSHTFIISFKSLSYSNKTIMNSINITERALYYKNQLRIENTIQSELAAFISYAVAFPDKFLCVVDSYDTIKSGLPNFLFVAFALMDAGYQPIGIRLDSGDIENLSLYFTVFCTFSFESLPRLLFSPIRLRFQIGHKPLHCIRGCPNSQWREQETERGRVICCSQSNLA